MIKFFRKIRQRLLSESKFSKYLLYAIGEIILVVIGILIALQINNLNETQKDRGKEQVILHQLKEDYTADLLQLEQKMEMRDLIIRSSFDILQAIDNPEGVDRDSLIQDLGAIIDDPTFDPIQNDLVSSGNLRLITNQKLQRLLSNWSSDVVALKEIEDRWSNEVNQLEKAYAEIGIGRDISNSWMSTSDFLWMLDKGENAKTKVIGPSNQVLPIDEIVMNSELESLVSYAITYNQPANVQSVALIKRINEILTLIDNEIKTAS
ncbi:MAG: hypothetical protein HKO93_00970 [Flavobacteriales bacterium]|nr:hypothetical protein [Flavobacteriales bacterium]